MYDDMYNNMYINTYIISSICGSAPNTSNTEYASRCLIKVTLQSSSISGIRGEEDTEDTVRYS